MICLRCLYRTSTRTISKPLRTLTTTPTSRAAQAVSQNTINSTPPQRTPGDTKPNPATSTPSIAQPFSTPLTPTPTPQSLKARGPARALSSVPAGTTLKGLNYFKNKPDPVAMEDSEYPEWLWTLLDERKGKVEGQKEEMDPRLFSKSPNARRMANKRARKMAEIDAESAAPKVPLHEQSIDLPGGEEAGQARGDLTKSMRVKRRRDIKEANFLKSMT